MKAICYARVSTQDQGESGLGLESQQTALETVAKMRGWEATHTHDIASGKSMRRPQLAAALETLRRGDAGVLVVSKLDRLSRSVADFTDMLARAKREGWSIAALDIGVDTSTPNGKLMAQIMMAMAEWEREMIGARTRDALAAAKVRGSKLGRPRNVTDSTVTLVSSLRAAGWSYGKIAGELTRLGVPTSQGGKWHASTVRGLG
jgi:DNA invertase Pin-like site-specific DNA recombinase